jgi:MEMO1 family protein
MRTSVVSGQFYPKDKEKLEKEIGKYVKVNPDHKIRGAIVPHAGYLFSGRCAGKVYSVLPWAETYIIIGTNHHGSGGQISVSSEDFETPLGFASSDEDFVDSLLRELKIGPDNTAHQQEHSIEVQLPFLQVTQKNFQFVPILLKGYDLETCKKLAEAIVKVARDLRRKIVVIASSDFTHTGPAYNFDGDIKMDNEAVNNILALDSDKFLEIAGKTTICGTGAIATLIEAMKLFDAKKPELLLYYDSSEILNNENKVGYAGIVFRTEEFT